MAVPTFIDQTERHGRPDDLVLAPRSLARGYFQERSLRDLVQRHASDTTSYYGAMIWNLMVLELWHRRYAP